MSIDENIVLPRHFKIIYWFRNYIKNISNMLLISYFSSGNNMFFLPTAAKLRVCWEKKKKKTFWRHVRKASIKKHSTNGGRYSLKRFSKVQRVSGIPFPTTHWYFRSLTDTSGLSASLWVALYFLSATTFENEVVHSNGENERLIIFVYVSYTFVLLRREVCDNYMQKGSACIFYKSD